MKTIAFILALINEAWSLIFKVALVIIAIVVAVGFLRSCVAGATLNEHSSCQQFEQADTTTQDNVLRDMTVAHHDGTDITLTRFSVTLYCNTHNDSLPIDGIYSSGDVGRQSAQAWHISALLFGAIPVRFSNSI